MTRAAARLAAVVLASGALVAATSGAAYALGEVRAWNSPSAPLMVSGYGSAGYGYGTWKASTGSDGTRSRLSANLRIRNTDNHMVFAKLTTQTNAGYCFQPEYTSCSASYFTYASSTTGRYAGSTYKSFGASTGVNASGNYVRGLVNVQLDIPWRDDPSSGTTYTQPEAY